jgi:hypothetical protein
MSLLRKLAVLGAAAEAARRYAQKNPDKAREMADKAARFADQRTKGKYHGQIESAKQKIAAVGGFGGPGYQSSPGPASGPTSAPSPGPTPGPTPPTSGPS